MRIPVYDFRVIQRCQAEYKAFLVVECFVVVVESVSKILPGAGDALPFLEEMQSVNDGGLSPFLHLLRGVS